MSKTTFIIYEKSYLIRKGLISVIEKIANTHILKQVDQDEELIEAMNLEPDFLILNSKTINDLNLKPYSKKTQFIAISENSTIDFQTDLISDTIYLDDSQSQILKKLNQLIGTIKTRESKSDIPEEISKREVDILKYIALGYSNKEIADILFLSTHTVVTHRKNITRKLGIKTVPGLTIYAILNKIIDINDTEKL